MTHGYERHVIISVVLEAFSSIFSISSDKFRLRYLPRASYTGKYGFISAPARFWDRGARCFVGRFVLELDEAAARFLEDR